MDDIHAVREIILTVEKKCLVLVLPPLGSIPLQARTKLKKSLKNVKHIQNLFRKNPQTKGIYSI